MPGSIIDGLAIPKPVNQCHHKRTVCHPQNLLRKNSNLNLTESQDLTAKVQEIQRMNAVVQALHSQIVVIYKICNVENSIG